MVLAALLAGSAGCGAAPPVSFELLAPAEARMGEPVRITLRLTNTGARPLELHLLGREIAFDITVTRQDGAVVWRRLERQTVPAILQLKILAPGERLELSDIWPQRDAERRPAAAGTYTLQGILPTDEPQPLRTPEVRLRVNPG